MLVKVNPASGFYVIHKKILTIAEDDNSVHTCSLSAFLPPNTKAIIIEATRTCAVALVVYPNSGSDDINVTDKALTFLPVSGAVPMFHVVGVTPESRTREEAFGGREPSRSMVIRSHELQEVEGLLNTTQGNEVDLVCFGCPHCTLAELQEAAFLLEGKKVSENVRLWLCTSMWFKDLAKRSGYLETIERAGGLILADICAGPSAPFNYLKEGIQVVATNSVKTAFYAPGTSRVDILFGDTRRCIEAAVSGKWRYPDEDNP